jgi:Kef-type K+ transport system membrane component KefB
MPLDPVLSAILVVCLLLALAKILSELFQKIGLPGVVGEVFAGVILGPYGLGAIPFQGKPLIQLGPLTLVFAYFGMIVLLFTAGLETTFAEFKAAGVPSFVVASTGAALPFAAAWHMSSLMGLSPEAGLVIGLALVQCDVAIIIRILDELKMMNLKDAKMIISIAVVADAIGLSLLTIVSSVGVANVPLTFGREAWIFARSLGLWFALVVGCAFLIPRFLKRRARTFEKQGTMEIAATVICFAAAGLSVIMGLSPLVGAFAAGMGIAGSGAIKRVKDYTESISIIFVPILFAQMGAQMNFAALLSGTMILLIVAVFAATEVATKLIGSGLPALYFLKDRGAGLRVGVATTCMGIDGMLALNIGLSHDLITTDVFTGMMLVCVLTTIISPLILKPLYARVDLQRSERKQGPSENPVSRKETMNESLG